MTGDFANEQKWEILDEDCNIEYAGTTEDTLEYVLEHQVYGKVKLA